MNKHLGSFAIVGLSVALLLPACGGSNSSGSERALSANAAAEGAWSGTTSTRNSFDMLVLENGDLYSFYGHTPVNGFEALGFIQGMSGGSGSLLAAPLVTNFNYDNTTVVRSTGSLTATIAASTSINGTSRGSGSASSTFTSTPTSVTYPGYSYSTPARLASVSGAWLGKLLDQTGAVVSISAAGVLSGTNLGCSFNGTVTPRSSGKNVFDIRITFGNAPCTAPGVATAGVAISYPLPSGKQRFIAATQDASKALGYLFYAER